MLHAQNILQDTRLDAQTMSAAGRPFRLRLCRAVAWLFLSLYWVFCPGHFCGAAEPPQLGPLGAPISDFDARLELARLLSYDSRRIDEALEQYRILKKNRPEDLQVRLEFSEVLIRGRRFDEAVDELVPLMRGRPDPDGRIAVALARAYAGSGNVPGALALLEPLFRKDDANPAVGRALVQIYRRLGNFREAFAAAARMRKLYPRDVDLLLELADFEFSAGHVQAGRRYFEDALRLAQNPEAVRLIYADRTNMWGDFNEAESIYRRFIAQHPADMEVRRKLAEVLVNAQRYEEAESIYRLLILDGYSKRVVLGDLAGLHFEAKNDGKALGAIEELSTLESKNGEVLSGDHTDEQLRILRLKSRVLARMHQWDRAVETVKQLADLPEERFAALLALGRIFTKKGDDSSAAAWFEKAYRLNPDAIPARFYHAGLKQVAADRFLHQTLHADGGHPMRLVEWGRLYAENGNYPRAVVCFRKALETDPECFPARLELAETLAYDRRYTESIEIFEALSKDFPDNRKILVSYARVLSWSKSYEESLKVYERSLRRNPRDPLPRMEMARTAAWAKKMDRALDFYGSLWEDPVDLRLAAALDTAPDRQIPQAAREFFDETRSVINERAIYRGYEYFSEKLFLLKKDIPAPAYGRMEKIAAELRGPYKIQKAARQESSAKHLAWNRCFPAAHDAYESLLDEFPSNQEALFDLAQVRCALGLCDREADAYAELLRLEPYHTLAARALQRQQKRKRPAAAAGFNYWHESGRGRLAAITRYRYDISLDLPLKCRYHLVFKGHRWNEDPEFGDRTYDARGFTLGLNGVLSPQVTAAAEWTRKAYSEDSIDETDTGMVNAWYRMDGGSKVGLGFDRVDELYNEFGIRRGIQSTSGWVAAETPVARRWDLRGQARYRRYNDDNEGRQVSLGGGYMVTDHPRLFKITLSADYRDTRKESEYRFDGGRLVDIVHPYWTPTHHGAGAVILEWNHDLADDFFCGARQHYYRMALKLGTESESNESAGLEGEWRYEFHAGWSLYVKGLVHRSGEWDADGLWAQIQYRF